MVGVLSGRHLPKFVRMVQGLPNFFEILSGWVDQAIFSPKFGKFGFLKLEKPLQKLLQGKQ
jgi:hypothetical protein